MLRYIATLAIVLCAGCSSPAATPSAEPRSILFDDFSYADAASMDANGWLRRTAAGWPGLAGATWAANGVTLATDADDAANKLVELTSSTDGTPEGTFQAQLCQQRKYQFGTFASRIRFNNSPSSGPDGDVVIQSFYSISAYVPLDPDYSELDFEYLPNGGWGMSGATLWMNSWETVRIEPWQADNSPTSWPGELTGWHTLVVTVSGQQADYYLDGRQLANHSPRFTPESPMSINYNVWFAADSLINSSESRTYSESVDWVFHAADQILAPDDVEAQVADYRSAGQAFTNSVEEWSPPAESTCDL
jgi:hypothetical protein